MCQEINKTCACGSEKASFHLRDHIMSEEVIDRLFCPKCSSTIDYKNDSMVNDNNWIIEYDMDLARMYAIAKLSMDPEQVVPEFVFDEGYITWREMYPGETKEIAEEREKIIAMKDRNPKGYLQKIQSWNVDRIARLKAEGWRKAARS